MGAWIAPELTGELGTVTSVVPNRFDSYVRVLHPPETRDGTLLTWGEVAAELGRPMHACRQWHVLVGSADPDTFEGTEWDGNAPCRGELVPEVFGPLCELLKEHTTDAKDCFFGLWTGWSQVVFHAVPEDGSEGIAPAPRFRSGDELHGPRLKLPNAGRDYALLAGPLSAAIQICDGDDEEVGSDFASPSPNLMWPADHSWFLASEIDFDSTLVGGTSELVNAILGAEEIESWQIGPNDSLAADGDAQPAE